MTACFHNKSSLIIACVAALPPIIFSVETSHVFTASFARKQRNLHCAPQLAAENKVAISIMTLFPITRNQFNKR